MVNFYSDESPLVMGDAVALILTTSGGKYLLQHRDDISGIWYPNKWGCFGGATDPGETPEQAIEREVYEEIGFVPDNMKPFCSLNFDMSDTAGRIFYRRYYSAVVEDSAIDQIKLGEGRAFGAFLPVQLDSEISITPYDDFALLLHCKREHYISVS